MVFLFLLNLMHAVHRTETRSVHPPPAPPNELEGALLDIASASTSYVSNYAFSESRNRLLQTVQSFVNNTALHLYGHAARDHEQLLDDKKKVRNHARKLLRIAMEKGTREGLKLYSKTISQFER